VQLQVEQEAQLLQRDRTILSTAAKLYEKKSQKACSRWTNISYMLHFPRYGS